MTGTKKKSNFRKKWYSPLLNGLCQDYTVGKTPFSVFPFYFGASQVALKNKDRGVRPIAIGYTRRCLVVKCSSSGMAQSMCSLLDPHHLGFGVRFEAEAVTHSARMYLPNLKPGNSILKLDLKNAFNTTRHDKILYTVEELAPELLPFIHSSYYGPSTLFFESETIPTSERVQQGDPLGPLVLSFDSQD